ncbi:MAG: hypothetical protein COT85_06150 [Chlamydiae bacterium CG10_big_fil_rev_8_21_14_0_10_42_34]|nr:MAG: hypothetical protein COT85_06150 [Chlamydiae bacterium CG10_big_fil_rev_8_21_14_0_10_42_34]
MLVQSTVNRSAPYIKISYEDNHLSVELQANETVEKVKTFFKDHTFQVLKRSERHHEYLGWCYSLKSTQDGKKYMFWTAGGSVLHRSFEDERFIDIIKGLPGKLKITDAQAPL